MPALSAANFHQRVISFQKNIRTGQAVLVSKPNDIFYLVGFPQLAPAEREAFLLILPKKAVLFHHSFSPTLPSQQWLKTVPKTELTAVAEQLKKTQTLFIDEQTLSVSEYKQLQRHVLAKLEPLNSQWIWKLRTDKDAQEIKLMKQAGKIAAKVMKTLQKELKTGVTELKLANKAAQLLLKNGAEGTAFPTIVAFGGNAALPHYQPGKVKLRAETPVLIDLGARYHGYCSDMTRTVWFGKKPSQQFQQVEILVKKAYQAAVRLISPTKQTELPAAQELDEAARGVITEAGFGKQFIHTTGHGLGLEIHEPPSLSWQNNTKLKPGMTLTIEPGIYLPGKLGYRHENTFLITNTKPTVLTQ